jgi:hypothetical protein
LHTGAQIDLLLFKNGRRTGVEIKRTDAPRLTHSMRTALTDLGFDRILVIYPCDRRTPTNGGFVVEVDLISSSLLIFRPR